MMMTIIILIIILSPILSFIFWEYLKIFPLSDMYYIYNKYTQIMLCDNSKKRECQEHILKCSDHIENYHFNTPFSDIL